MAGRDRWGGSEQGDESRIASAAEQDHFSDNEVVENNRMTPHWYQDGIVRVTRRIYLECKKQISRTPIDRRTELRLALCWLKFDRWCELVLTTTEPGCTVENFFGETLVNFPHAYGMDDKTRERFLTSIIPRAVAGPLPKSLKQKIREIAERKKRMQLPSVL